MELLDRLKQKRKAILKKIDLIDSAESLYQIQVEIVEEIKISEKQVKQDVSGEYEGHIHLLRCYCDGLAWNLLYSHTIRQLAKNWAPPQSISNQGNSFNLVMQKAKELSNEGKPVIIADITNIIKIGDLIVCSDPEMPSIVECKKGNFHPHNIMKGRSGRQLSRAIGTLEYLKKGKAKVFGEEKERVVFETTTEVIHNWQVVKKSVIEALETGIGFGKASDYDIMWAIANDEITKVQNEIEDILKSFKEPFVGCHLRVVEEMEFLHPPPSAWPIDIECRFALMEGDVVLFHLIDLSYFNKLCTPDGRIKGILYKNNVLEEYCFVVEVNGQERILSARFLNDVLYGYATIESIFKNMIEFAKRVCETKITPEKIRHRTKPKLKVINSLEDAIKLGEEVDKDNSPNIIVMLKKEILEEIIKSLE